MPTPSFGRFFLPGPTEVLPEILEAQTRPMIGHRGGAMEDLMASIQPSLRRLFRTARPVYVSTSSATGLMEAAVRNLARRRVLALVNGAFSERFAQVARACGLQVDTLEVAWGEIHPPELVAEVLSRGAFDTVTVVHSETSTGALNPIAALARAARDAGDVALLVDSVSGVGGAPVEPDAWELDFVFTGSQKALALPPGLAFGVVQESAIRRAALQEGRGTYFDFLEFERYLERNQTPNTPAVSLLHALAAQLARIDAESIEQRWARHARMAERTWTWAATMCERGVAISVLAPEGARSPTVTCLRLPTGKTGPAVVAALKERGYTITTGYGKLRETCIRIGHMGDHTLVELDHLLAQLEEVLAR